MSVKRTPARSGGRVTPGKDPDVPGAQRADLAEPWSVTVQMPSGESRTRRVPPSPQHKSQVSLVVVSLPVSDAREMVVPTSDELASILGEAQEALEHADEAARTQAAHDEAGATFAQVLREVLGDRPISAQEARRAALAAAAGTVWEDAVGPLLSSEQTRGLWVSRQRLSQLAGQQQLIALRERSGKRVYPGWQFGEDARPLDALVSAHHLLVDRGAMSEWSAASWAVHEHPELDDRSPRDWAAADQDAERLMLVARRDAAASAH